MAGTGWWLRAVACSLSAAGLVTRLESTAGLDDRAAGLDDRAAGLDDRAAGLDLIAVARLPNQRDVDVVIDEECYAEVRFWVSPAATPLEITAAITRALVAIAPVAGPNPPPTVAPSRPSLRAVARYDGAVTDWAGETGMPGAQDRVIEQEYAPREVDESREEPIRRSELQERLERLPRGHPSSPFRDDGSRKPSPPDLAEFELPLPSDSEPTTDDPHLARTAPDGSWEWKGRRLGPEQSKAGDRALERCRVAEGRDADGNYGEHGLTPAMRRIEAQLDHGRLVDRTEEFALKSPDRFKEKLARLIARNPDKPTEELTGEIHDAVRYTFKFDVDRYCESLWNVDRKISEEGYELEVRRNLWASPEYKGTNSRWYDPLSGVRFEVQFHTQASWEAKQLTHEAYEKIADQRTSPDEVKQLRAFQAKISSNVEAPPGVIDIPDYRKDGR